MAKRKRNPRHTPTIASRVKVETLAGCGARHELICEKLGVSIATLRAHYADELDRGMHAVDMDVLTAFARIAKSSEMTGPSVTAKIFWLKSRLGWRDVARVEHSGPDGGPIETNDARETLSAIVRRAQRSMSTDDIPERN